jgi:hypothetical protein
MATIVVGGALANKYRNGGEAWVRLSWVHGFAKLGHHVHFVEQIDPAQCQDHAGQPAPFERCAAREYFQEVITHFGLSNAATLVFNQGE